MQKLTEFVHFYREMTGTEPQGVLLTLPPDQYVGVATVDGVVVERGAFGIGPKPQEAKAAKEEKQKKASAK